MGRRAEIASPDWIESLPDRLKRALRLALRAHEPILTACTMTSRAYATWFCAM
jgi:hypothetical protein